MTFDEWESKTVALAGESPNAYARRAFNAALKLAAGASEGQAVGEMAVTSGALGGKALVWFTEIDQLPIGTKFYTHPSAELTALRERIDERIGFEPCAFCAQPNTCTEAGGCDRGAK